MISTQEGLNNTCIVRLIQSKEKSELIFIAFLLLVLLLALNSSSRAMALLNYHFFSSIQFADGADGIAINVIKLESEGLRAVKELAAKKNNTLLNNNLQDDDDGRGPDTNNWQHHQRTH